MNLFGNKNKEENIYFYLTLVFGIYFIVACYKLTNASLWFDETIEFYYSKVMFGSTPDGVGSNMYQRIITTFQPPLYNFVLYFWLKISEAEWWFRFAGVVTGFFGAIAIYKTINKLTNFKLALLSVILFTFNSHMIYYIQECAEYNLMITLLFWTIYFYICVLEKTDLHNILFFVLFSVLSIYAQYGSAFLVIPLLCSFFILILMKKDKKNILNTFYVYAGAFLFTAIPLYLFFLKPQMENQSSATSLRTFQDVIRKLGDFQETYKRFFEIFKKNMTSINNTSSNIALSVLLILLFVIIIHYFIVTKNKMLKSILICNVVSWFFYYIAVLFGIYSYGWPNAGRYTLFFTPLWMVTIILILYEYYHYLSVCSNKNAKKFQEPFKALFCLVVFCLCLNNWNTIQINWGKEHSRDVVNAWYEAEAYKSDTFVYYAAATGFSYYAEHDKRFQPQYLDRVKIQSSQEGFSVIRARTKEEQEAMFLEYYGGTLPEELYISFIHEYPDKDVMLEVFKDKGYKLDCIYNRWGSLWHIYKEN